MDGPRSNTMYLTCPNCGKSSNHEGEGDNPYCQAYRCQNPECGHLHKPKIGAMLNRMPGGISGRRTGIDEIDNPQ